MDEEGKGRGGREGRRESRSNQRKVKCRVKKEDQKASGIKKGEEGRMLDDIAGQRKVT